MNNKIKIIIIILAVTFSALFAITIKKAHKLYTEIKEYYALPLEIMNLNKEEDRAITIKDRNGLVLSTLYPEYGGKFIKVEYKDISTNIINALISAEDKNFFKHNGINLKAISRSFYYNIKNRAITTGASTITQQLVKMLKPRSRTYKNKLYEAIDSIKLEKYLSKEEIITIYLNRVFFGNNNYGIGVAVDSYFKKNIADIDVNEAAFLVSIIKSGTKFNPYKESERLNKRREYTLTMMKQNNFIDENIFNEYINKDIVIDKDKQDKIKAPHFSMYIKNSLEKLNIKEVVEVNTTLDIKMQDETELIIKNSGKWLKSYNARNIACVILDSKTLEILTMIGSSDYYDTENNGSVNGATSLRQAGSTLKPFFYAYAFDEGDTPATIIPDLKINITSPGGDYIPDNFDKKFRGPVSVRDALANSLNVPAVSLLTKHKTEDFQKKLLSVGLSSINKNPDYYGLSLVLGSPEVSLLDLATAYSVFANDGVFINNSSIRQIKKSDNSVVKLKPKNKKVVYSPETTYQITSILTDKRARMSSFPNPRGLVYPFSLAFKTGTSKGSRDAWAIGYTKDYIVGIWLGDFKGSDMANITGGNGALPIVYDIFIMLNKDLKETKWNRPKTIIEKEICLLSGKLKTENCKESRVEVFNLNNVVEDYCNVHKIFIREDEDGKVQKKVFTILPPEYKDFSIDMGYNLPDNTWAEYNNKNITKTTKILNNKLAITTPTQNSVYKIDSSIPIEYQKIKLNALLPDNIVSANLYCDNKLLGDLTLVHNIYWQLEAGEHSFFIEALFDDETVRKSRKVDIVVR